MVCIIPIILIVLSAEVQFQPERSMCRASEDGPGQLLSNDPIKYPSLSADQAVRAAEILDRLEDEPTVLARAHDELVRLGPGIVPGVLDRLAAEQAQNIQQLLRDVLEAFANIEITALSAKRETRVGEPLPLQISLCNRSEVPIPVLPAVDGSDYGRFPRYIIEVRDERGRLWNIQPPIRRCGNVDPITEDSFVILEPGASLSPFHSPYMHYMLHWWEPTRPGVYNVRCIYEGGPQVYDNTLMGFFRAHMVVPTPVLRTLFDRMPVGKYVSNDVTIVVQ